jgi:hypothetical protein
MTPAVVEAYVLAASASLDLHIAAAYQPGVQGYFSLAAEMAALVDAVALAPHDEAAVHFSPIVPGSGKAI